jgi:hypothetical protein
MNESIICALLASFLLSASARAEPKVIDPGAVWPDDRGRHIQAHGGAIIKLANSFYWFGEDRSPGNDPHKRYVACYASNDLAHWTFRNQVLKLELPEIGPKLVLERPKVYFNSKTGKFVMYMHIDGPGTPEGKGNGYALARVGVATCDTVDGNYAFLRSFRPLNQESRDIGQFVDDDGLAYLIFESRPSKGFFIASLSEDYLDVKKGVAFIPMSLEGNALVHYKGLYYVVGSGLTGWGANSNKYASAEHLEGPWSAFQDIAAPASKTYGSQSTFLLKITGSKTTSVIFMADIWKPRMLSDSRYLWMPLEIGAGKLTLPKPQPWSIDVGTGETVVGK